MEFQNRHLNGHADNSEQQEMDSRPTDDVIQDITFQKFRERLEDLQQKTINNVNDQLKIMVTEIMSEFEKSGASQKFIQLFYNMRSLREREGKIRNKEFIPRNSLLTDLFEVKHMSTLHNIFLVMLSVLFCQVAICDLLDTGELILGFRTMKLGFGKFNYVILSWLFMFIPTLTVYYFFGIWANVRRNLKTKSARFLWDRFWVINYAMYQALFFFGFGSYLSSFEFPFGSAMIVFCEQIRLMMKAHAFIRTSTANTLSKFDKDDNERKQKLIPEFSKYLYFLFAPTLVYRDNYPRTKKVRWNIVLWNAGEVILVLFFVCFLIERFILPSFRDYGLKYYEPKTLVVTLFMMLFPSILIYLCGFYLLLHAWHNAWAEVLLFADRLFYQDWWNSTTYSEFYRKWNIIVHDWLYTYVYKDCWDYVFPKNLKLSFLSVFIISSIVHEYIIALSVRFFYPVMLIFFGIVGVMAIFVTKSLDRKAKMAGNLFLWHSLFYGTGLMISFYTMEFFARQNCSVDITSNFINLIPRSWICNVQH